jgi:acetylornithine/succinyldiaminopimelate/putrescine aminotransferase
MAKAKASSVFTPGDHASTFGGNPLVTACAKVVLDEIECNNLLENVKKTGDYLKEELDNLKLKTPSIKDVRGLGLMLGVEFSTPVSDIVQDCQDLLLMLISAGEKVIRFIPQLIVSKDDAAEAIAIFSGVLERINA